MIGLAADYYWPLLEEVRPKLGRYKPAVVTAQEIAQNLFQHCATHQAKSILIHRQLVSRYAKSFEILEYAGFIRRREASRALKSGGRGARFSVNLCNLLELLPGSRMTAQLFEQWLDGVGNPVELHERGAFFEQIAVPKPTESGDMEILDMSVAQLAKSSAYPYGLTDQKIAGDFNGQSAGKCIRQRTSGY